MVSFKRLTLTTITLLIVIVCGCSSLAPNKVNGNQYADPNDLTTSNTQPQSPNLQQRQAHYQTALTELTVGNTDNAMLEVKLALQDNPLDADAHFLFGCILEQKGEYDQAVVAFQRASALDPSNSDALYNLGTMLLQQGDALTSAKLLENTVLIRPDNVTYSNNLAKAYYLAGLPELAVATYEETLNRDPYNTTALKNLLLLAEADGKYNTADIFRKRLMLHESGRPTEFKMDIEKKTTPLPIWPLATITENTPSTSPVQTKSVQETQTDDTLRMIEVDAVIFSVSGIDQQSVGYNFLKLIDMNFNFFATDNKRDGTGFTAPPAVTGTVSGLSQSGWIFSAAASYSVNIANASAIQVAVLARPHLTALSGTSASFLAGGELVYKVSGINSGDIKPYPFGTNLKIIPTILRPTDANTLRVHLKIEAGRTSVSSILEDSDPEKPTSFEKVQVISEAVLNLGQTLILSGLSQRESRTSRSGVPFLMDIPLLKYFFSTTTTVEVDAAVIILLAPRDPAFLDERNRKDFNEFVQTRRAFIKAKQGTEADLRQFREEHPNWNQIPPNRFATQISLSANSEIYRIVTGQELLSEELNFELLGPKK
jgi:Tfp pilus assembly protein PilF